MNNEKRSFPTVLTIGEVRYPQMKQRNYEGDRRMYISFGFEAFGPSSVNSTDIIIDEGLLNKSTGELTHFAVFDKAKELNHGSKVVLVRRFSVVVKNEQLYVNDNIIDIFPFTERLARELSAAGFKIN